MVCENCKTSMNWFSENSVQGWRCSGCGWSVVTTDIDNIYKDMTQYSIYIKKVNNANMEQIKIIAKIAGVNYLAAKQMLMENHACILKDNAPKVKDAIKKLKQRNIPFKVRPQFEY